MITLSEFLNSEKNQDVVLEKIIEALRARGEWGKYGLFSKIGGKIGFSASYVSKSLMKKKPLRENFVQKMAEYLGVSASWLCGYVDCPEWLAETCAGYSYEQEVEGVKSLQESRAQKLASFASIKEELGNIDEFQALIRSFFTIPKERRKEALRILDFLSEYIIGEFDLYNGDGLYHYLFSKDND